MMYDFFLYTGAATKDGKKVKVTGPYAVRKRHETLPKNQHYRVFFHSWFCTLDLCRELKSLGFLVSATARSDRIGKCPLMTEKDLIKEGRGSYDYRTDMSIVNVFTSAQRMLVRLKLSEAMGSICKQIHQRSVSRDCPRI